MGGILRHEVGQVREPHFPPPNNICEYTLRMKFIRLTKVHKIKRKMVNEVRVRWRILRGKFTGLHQNLVPRNLKKKRLYDLLFI